MSIQKQDENKIRFGVVGVMGYSRSHIGQILSAQGLGEPIKLEAVLAYMREKNEKFVSELELKGVKLAKDYTQLLGMKDSLDCITLPVGIPLHTSMGIKALEAGFPVYLEKPVAGSIQDVDTLCEVEKQTGNKLFIGYQLCFQPSTWEFKRKLLSGDIGKIKKIVVVVDWPRSKSYYNRNDWAGKLSYNGVTIYDSPLNNACAHYMNLPLFLAGEKENLSAVPIFVEAELYRANDIESADTVSLRVMTEEGVEIFWSASHTCEATKGPRVRIEGSKKTLNIDYSAPEKIWYEGCSGVGEVFFESKEAPSNPFVQTAKWLKGEKNVPICDLKIARAQTVVVNGAHKADIATISSKYVKEIVKDEGNILVSVIRMNEILDKCYEKGCLISEVNGVPWSTTPTGTDISDISKKNNCLK